MTPTARAFVLACALSLGAASANAGQAPDQPRSTTAAIPARGAAINSPGEQVPLVSDEDAERSRERLRTILRQYPPSLADVLRLDPSLLTNDAYLAPYPLLAGFLRQNPGVARNPAFFVGQNRSEWDEPGRYNSAAHELSQDFAGFLVFGGLVTFMGLIAWGIRNLVNHRRWLRASKVQSEAHAKVFDRLASNEDLLAYIQSPAGQRYLQSEPLAFDSARPFGAPVARILFASQAGTVVAFLGLGLWFSSTRLAVNPNAAEVAPIFFTASMVVIAVGLGFLASAAIAYLLSRQLGLLGTPDSSHA